MVKTWILIFAGFIVACASGIGIPALPPSEFTDTEVSTNFTFAVGYDCGEWLVRSAANDSVTYSDVVDSGVFRRTYEVRSRHVDPSWNLVKVTRRGSGVANEGVTIELVESGFGLTIK